jgi:HD-GYP domain-containing protein (c-di-GMP phosphodiesterase class II)
MREQNTDEQLVEVPTIALRPGMFVAELDRPWLETPFAVQGFMVHSQTDMNLLAAHCDSVFVDLRRSTADIPDALLNARRRRPQEPSIGLRAEFHRAKLDFSSARDVVSGVFERIGNGGELNVARLAAALNPIIDSVLRNQNAMAILARLKTEDDYTFGHCVSCAVWAAIMGRHLALERQSLESLVLGSALIDVGKADLPKALLDRPGPLDDTELALIQSHVGRGVAMVGSTRDVNFEVLSIVESHHERWDGSGYPEGRKGGQIPLLARIAGMVDTYDAMITQRPWKAARSSFEAIQELRDLAGTKFQAELVEQFVAAIGLFPTGSVVELNTGEVGIVTRQNPVRRLKPEMVLVLSPDKKPLAQYRLLDLMREGDALTEGGGRWIIKELPRGAYDIKAEDFYL